MTKSSMGDEMWLGYAELNVELSHVMAVVRYQNAWDRRIVQSHGALPPGVRCVVLLEDGRVFPARRALDDLHRQWTAWQAAHAS